MQRVAMDEVPFIRSGDLSAASPLIARKPVGARAGFAIFHGIKRT
jgi:hypothetical protein